MWFGLLGRTQYSRLSAEDGIFGVPTCIRLGLKHTIIYQPCTSLPAPIPIVLGYRGNTRLSEKYLKLLVDLGLSLRSGRHMLSEMLPYDVAGAEAGQ